MSKTKNEVVSVSFHYLSRRLKQASGEYKEAGFSEAEFHLLFQKLAARPKFDPSDEAQADRVRFRQEAPLEHLERLDGRTIFGTYEASYWGHSYRNTVRGEIPPESISLRPFHFLLYLSKSGRVYLGTQYLGQFGGYGAIERTVRDCLPADELIASSTFRLGGANFANAQPREVKVQIADRSSSIAKANQFGDSAMVIFKKKSKYDGFEGVVSDKILSHIDRPKAILKKAVAELANQSQLITVRDVDIEDCTVIALVNGKRKTINVLEEGSFATKFPIDVPLTALGHPDSPKTKAAMLKLLSNQIIARNES